MNFQVNSDSWCLLQSTVYQDQCQLQNLDLNQHFAKALQIHCMYMSCIKNNSYMSIYSLIQNIIEYRLWELTYNSAVTWKTWNFDAVLVGPMSDFNVAPLQFNIWVPHQHVWQYLLAKDWLLPRKVKAASEMELRATWTVFVLHDAVATIIDAFDWNWKDRLYNPSTFLKMWFYVVMAASMMMSSQNISK